MGDRGLCRQSYSRNRVFPQTFFFSTNGLFTVYNRLTKLLFGEVSPSVAKNCRFEKVVRNTLLPDLKF